MKPWCCLVMLSLHAWLQEPALQGALAALLNAHGWMLAGSAGATVACAAGMWMKTWGGGEGYSIQYTQYTQTNITYRYTGHTMHIFMAVLGRATFNSLNFFQVMVFHCPTIQCS